MKTHPDKQMVNETTQEYHKRIKTKLLEMAKNGQPRPKSNSILGKLLKQFTTPSDN